MDRERTCIGCRRKARKENLLRIVRVADGGILVDSKGKGPGRGAYVCSQRCLDEATDSGALARALRHQVTADDCTRLRSQAHALASEGFAKGSEE